MSNVVFDKFKLYFNETKSNKFYILLYFVLMLIFSISMLNVAHLLHYKFIILVIISLLILGIFFINYHTLHDNELYKTVFIIVLIIGLICAFTNPILAGPDEEEHMVRSLYTSEGDLFPESIIDNSFHSNQFVNDLLNNRFSTFLDSDITNNPMNTSESVFYGAYLQNPFYGYLVTGLGIFLANLFSLSAMWAMWLPRIFSVLIYAICAAVAVKKAPFAKIILVAMACIPLALFQASVIGIDYLINGLALIIVAYILSFFKDPNKITKKDILFYSLLCIAIGLCRVTCFAFILFLLFLPIKKLKNKKIFVYGLIIVVIATVIALLWSEFFANPNYLNSWRLSYMIGNNVNSTLQTDYIFSHFQSSLSVILNSVIIDSIKNIYFLNLFSFPYNNIVQITPLIAHFYLLFLGFLFVFYPLKEKLSINLRLSSLIISFIYILGTVVVFYLTWTPVGLNSVLGIQSRYFVPICLLFPFIINLSSKFNLNKDLVDKTVIVLTIAFAFSVVLSNLFFYY